MLRKEQPGGIIQLHVRRTLLPAAAGAASQGLGSSTSGAQGTAAEAAGPASEVVISSEMSSWLLVTDTFSPGDIKR
jgi:hypothetical protein